MLSSCKMSILCEIILGWSSFKFPMGLSSKHKYFNYVSTCLFFVASKVVFYPRSYPSYVRLPFVENSWAFPSLSLSISALSPIAFALVL
eukprot:c8263_g1_i1 orf=210-476(+)